MTTKNKKNVMILSTVPPKGVNSGRVEKIRYRCEKFLQNGIEPIVVRPEFKFYKQKIDINHGTVTYYGRPVEDFNTGKSDHGTSEYNYTELVKSLSKKPIFKISNLITDSQLAYTLTTTNLLFKIINKNTICLNTQSYPFTNNLIGLITKTMRPDTFWLMEYRDPWVTNANHRDKNSQYISQFLERTCINNCDKAIYYEGMQIPDGYFEVRYPSEHANIHSVGYWGYNDILINNTKKRNLQPFSIIYAGSFWGRGTNLSNLFTAVEGFVSENNIHSNEFQLLFLGDKPNNIPKKIVEYIKPLGWVPYEVAIEYIKGSDYGLYINRLYDRDELNVSTKMFDYIGCNIPVLCLSRPNWESWEFVKSNEIGMVAKINDANDIRKKISRAYYQENEISQCVRSRFSREKQFRQIISLIESNDDK